MNSLILVSLILSVLLGIFRGIDLTFWTDAETGLCVAGPVWLRYAALAAVVGIAVAAGRGSQPKPDALRGRCIPSGVAALAAAVCYGETAVLRILWMHSSVVMLLRAVLEALCAFWMLGLGLSWLRKDWKAPTRSLTPAVLGSVIFYWCVLARFMENSSSWHRVSPTAQVWVLLGMLVFLSRLVRALWLPETSDGKALCASGLAAFVLGFCWELPQTLTLAMPSQFVLTALPSIFFGLGIACLGTLGVFCTVRTAGPAARKK